MPTAYAYIRVSTDHQADSGLGLEAQERVCRSYYDFRLGPRGLAWGGCYKDAAVSGARPLAQRPEGGRMDAGLRAGDAVVFARLDRGFRDVADLLLTIDAWQAAGVQVHICDLPVDITTDVGRMFLTVLGALARFERDRIGGRIRDAMAAARRRGLRCNGSTPYGFRKLGKQRFQPDAAERAVMAQIVEFRDQQVAWEQIHYRLRDQGVRTRDGRVWSVCRIRRAYQAELALREKEQANNGGVRVPAGVGGPPTAP